MKIRYEKKGPVAVFTLDNGKVNALTPPMHRQMFEHMRDFIADREVRVGILTGAGDRAFCGGDDIKHDWSYPTLHQTLDAHFWASDDDSGNGRPGWERELKQLERFKPIIAAVNGPCLGMGMIYLLSFSDIRIAVPHSFFGLPEIAYGMGGASGTVQLGRHLPPTVALAMALVGEPLSAEDALRHSLINEIVQPGALMTRAHDLAATIASHPPLAVRVEMETFYRGMDMTRRDSLAFATHLYRLQRATYLTGEGTERRALADDAPERNR